MERNGSVTLIHIKKGATSIEASDVTRDCEIYCCLPGADSRNNKVEKVLREKGFKLGDGASPHTSESEEDLHIQLLTYTHNDGVQSTGASHNAPVFSGNGGLYYYLPGNSYEQVIEALKGAGCECNDRLLDIIDAAYKNKRNS